MNVSEITKLSDDVEAQRKEHWRKFEEEINFTQIEKIENQIKSDSTAIYHRSIKVTSDIGKATREHLKEKGFKVNSSNDPYIMSYWIISW